MKRGLALVMIAAGALLLAGLAAFIKIALDYRHSFTASNTPLGDWLQGLTLLAPVVAGAVAIVFGFRWRKA